MIVVFYDRREFLGAALSSLLRQTLPAHRFEVILVGPTHPREFLPESIVPTSRFVSYKEASVAGKIVAGIRNARASLVTFLEDDDRYEPSRLEYVVKRFSADEGLSYLQNGYRAISDSDESLPGPIPHGRALARWIRRGPVAVKGPPTRKQLSRLTGIPAGFNISSIAVRAECVRGRLDLLEQMDVLVDTTLLYAALTWPGRLVFDPIPLTDVRVHATSLSNPQIVGSRRMSKMRDLLIRSGPDFKAIHEHVAGSGPPAVVRASEGQVAAMRWLLELRGGASQGSERARAILPLCSRLDTFEVMSRWPLVPLAAISLVSPSLASEIYFLITSLR